MHSELRRLAALAIALVALLPAFAEATPKGESRVEEHTFYSESIGAQMHYYAYLPPGYDVDPRARYPVAYVLHGMGGSDSEWGGYGIYWAADYLLERGEIEPFVIVAPLGDQGYWFDHADGKNYGTYVAREVVAEIDGRYRTIPSRDGRAIGGLSMGAYGALQLGINYPDVFGAIGSHGPTIRDYDSMAAYLGPEMAGRWLQDRDYFARFDPLRLFRERVDVARSLDIEIDVGADDATWRPVADAFHRELLELGIPHEWHVYPGDHNGDRYWRPHTQDFLRFYDRAFDAVSDQRATTG